MTLYRAGRQASPPAQVRRGSAGRWATLGVVALFMLAGTLRWADGRYLLVRNQSASLDGSVYLIDLRADTAALATGAVVAFAGDNARWGLPADKPWAKRLAGMPGDAIEVRDGVVSVGGSRAAALSPAAMARATLSAVAAGQVPADHLFVLGDHPDSLDSRYREFGFVAHDQVLGEAHRLW